MTVQEVEQRLEQIAKTSFQDLDDRSILELLAERRSLLMEQERLAKEAAEQMALLQKQKDEEARLLEEQKKKELKEKIETFEARLEEVNKKITGNLTDDALLAIINERKEIEAELAVLTIDDESSKQTKSEAEEILPIPALEAEEASETEAVIPSIPEEVTFDVNESQAEEVLLPPKGEEEKMVIDPNSSFTPTHVSEAGQVSGLETPSEGRISLDTSLQSAEYQGYLSELRANINSLGTFLQGLPMSAKRNRAFMLEVAKVDPAYAMHYADKDTLKKDESFNEKVAGMNNQRNTGNALSEMLPEMRTGRVLLAGVKNDFRNVRFVRPEMPEYEEILALAKKGALEALSSLKDAHDTKVLLPPILQKDKAFMAQVAQLTNK